MRENGIYNFLFVFPFNITRIIDGTENLHFNSTPLGSVVWLKYHVAHGPAYKRIFGRFSIQNTFQSGKRGFYMFFLPFSPGVHPEIIEDLQTKLDIGSTSLDMETYIQFSFPKRYQMTQAFPPMSTGPDILPTNRTLVTVTWNFSRSQDSITVYCQDQDEITHYQNCQFYTGLCLGIGIPLIVETLYETAKGYAFNYKLEERR